MDECKIVRLNNQATPIKIIDVEKTGKHQRCRLKHKLKKQIKTSLPNKYLDNGGWKGCKKGSVVQALNLWVHQASNYFIFFKD